MPDFEHVVTIIALLTGPAGIWFGWWLSQRGAERRAATDAADAASAAERERVLQILKGARRLASEARSLAHATYLTSGRGKSVSGFESLIASFNTVRSDYREILLHARVLGPTWIVGPAENIELAGQRMTELIAGMQESFTGHHVAQLNETIPAMDTEVDALIALTSARYNPDAGTLPPRPNLEPLDGDDP